MSDKLRAAAQRALETLEDIFGKNKIDVGAINMLRAALEEPAIKESLTAQRPWVGLTGPEVDKAYKSVSDKEWAIGGLTDARVFFCAIEAKLREKNT
ncbi:hypothetical protein UFOVP1174_39 [uncultured Caudovirales phage]|uniref:Uncharacterized protein n=1 Tax=uncultured Caudovirales phage TaxID=2100421 RepID=A0A6J5R4H6_9CAUD|nr:hypothetical protein UFOVP1174_39 [uncultured Caudovirales phage]